MKRTVLLILSFILMLVSLYLVFFYVPTEKEMGIIQRIVYLMVPMAWLAILAFLVTFIGSIAYLAKKQPRWDILANSSAELGIIFTACTCLVGSIWARPVWNAWWTGEARLTATLILLFIYVAYFMVRGFANEEYRGATFAAVVAIIGFADIPIIGMATTIWRGNHPPLMIFEGGMDPRMLVGILVSVLTFTVIYVTLLILRVSMRDDEAEIKKLKELYS